MNTTDIIRQHLIELRESHGWTQADVAAKLNMSQRAYSHYENGSRNISVDTLVIIARLYGVSTDFLVGEEH